MCTTFNALRNEIKHKRKANVKRTCWWMVIEAELKEMSVTLDSTRVRPQSNVQISENCKSGSTWIKM